MNILWLLDSITLDTTCAMWQPTWSPHPPQGALQGQQVGTSGPPFQGIQPNAIVAQPMNQPQWVGPSPGSHGCPQGSVASPVLGPPSFHGPGGQLPSNFSSSLGPPTPGHQGQGFAVQCKHHQGCHSSTQSQQLMVGSIPSGSFWPWLSTWRTSRNNVALLSCSTTTFTSTISTSTTPT